MHASRPIPDPLQAQISESQVRDQTLTHLKLKKPRAITTKLSKPGAKPCPHGTGIFGDPSHCDGISSDSVYAFGLRVTAHWVQASWLQAYVYVRLYSNQLRGFLLFGCLVSWLNRQLSTSGGPCADLNFCPLHS